MPVFRERWQARIILAMQPNRELTFEEKAEAMLRTEQELNGLSFNLVLETGAFVKVAPRIHFLQEEKVEGGD